MKKLLSLFLVVCVSVSLCVTLAACGGTGSEIHTHDFDTEWSKNSTHHWHKCADSECTQISDKAEHSFTDGRCLCGYENEQLAEHVCTPQSAYSCDETYHWYGCSDEQCELYSVKEEHSFTDGVCKCGYENVVQHTCEFKTDWSYDALSHWNDCKYDSCDEVKDKAHHRYNDDGKCLDCGFKYSESEGLVYVLSEDGTYYIVAGIGTCTDEHVFIPAEYNGKPVKEIYDNAFVGSSIKSIYTGKSVVRIGYAAFASVKTLVSVYIGESCTTIDDGVFSQCSSLADISIPDAVETIGSIPFYGCTKLSLTEYEGAHYVGNRTNPYLVLVQYKTGATSCTVNSKTKIISSNAFNRATALEYISIPKSVKFISDAFFLCTSLTNIDVAVDNTEYKTIDGSLYSKDGKILVQYATGKKDASFVIPDGVEVIGPYAVAHALSLTDVVVSEGVITISKNAFDGCTSLSNVDFESTQLASIHGYAFQSCSSLKEIVIPEGIETLNVATFMACENLEEITIPKSVVVIDMYAFWMCEKLSVIYYGGSESDWENCEINDVKVPTVTVVYNATN